jgi:hypothetical protein
MFISSDEMPSLAFFIECSSQRRIPIVEYRMLFPCSDKMVLSTVKKRLVLFPSPAGISLTKLSLAGNNLIIPDQGGLVTGNLF